MNSSPAKTSVPWPPCEQACEVYLIDLDICEIAGELWVREGEQFAILIIKDAARGLDLMLEAAINVTRHRAAHPDDEIKSLKSYLRKSFERLVLAEQKKYQGQVLIEDTLPKISLDESQEQYVVIPADATQERNAYINEIKRVMSLVDKDLPRVFELRAAGYNWDEIAPHYKKKANHLRSWFSKKMEELKHRLQEDD